MILPPHQLLEARLKTKGWALSGPGNGGLLNVWESPQRNERDDIWVPQDPSKVDYQRLVQRAAAQLDKWERTHSDQTELKSLLAELQSTTAVLRDERHNENAEHAAARTDGYLEAIADVIKLLERRLEAQP